jgi:hypothetical protein
LRLDGQCGHLLSPPRKHYRTCCALSVLLN